MLILDSTNAITFSGKTVLVRVDWNVPIDGDMISDHSRLWAVRDTLSLLQAAGAKVIVLTHRGRPTAAKKAYKETVTAADPKNPVDPLLFMREDYFSFQPLMEEIRTTLKLPLIYCANPLSPEGRGLLKRMTNGDIVVCDNIRFFGGEEASDEKLADELAGLASVYVNDSFSCCHRAHVSTTALAKRLPAYAGVGMARELDCLQKALTKPKRPLWAIVGGAKVSSKIDVLLNLSQKVDGLIIGGAMAHTFLKAKGVSVGKSLVEDDLIDVAANILKRATCEIVLPVDGRSAAGMDQPYIDVSYDGLPSNHAMFDIGPKTIDLFKEKLSHARSIIWNGPVGVFEVEAFQGGTCALAAEVARLTTLSGVITVAGGGDTLAALQKANVKGKLTFESTAGGAFLEWLEGKALPGIVALEEASEAPRS